MGKVFGYVRVSSDGQRSDRQHAALLEANGGVSLDAIFEDKISGRSRADRPELNKMLDYALREGDTVKVASTDRLARSLVELLELVRDITAKGCTLHFIKESLTFNPGGEHGDAYAAFQLSVLGAVAQLERSLIHERQREGIALAKERGVYRGRKPALDTDMIAQAREWLAEGRSKAEVARELGVGRSSLYRALGQNGTYARDDNAA